MADSISPVKDRRGRGLQQWKGDGTAGGPYALKRPLDIALSVVGLAVTAPAFGLIALMVRLEDGGPVFYTQERMGRDGRPFRLFKFRSMVPDAEARTGPAWAAEGDPRVTRIGRLLRRTALDELPQLLNIARGDISFVGPRSHRAFFYDKFSQEVPGYRERYALQPGLTGLAQVFGKYDSSAQQKLRFDLLYARRRSLGLDLKLIVASVLISLSGKWDERRGRKIRMLHSLVRVGTRRRRPAGEAGRIASAGGDRTELDSRAGTA